MNILVITDLHNKINYIPNINETIIKENIDVVFTLGDLVDSHSSLSLQEIFFKINSKIFAIPGNCDYFNFTELFKENNHLNNVTNIHQNCEDYNGFTIVGLGGGLLHPYSGNSTLTEEKIMKELELISKFGMILLSHNPPFGINDKDYLGVHQGSNSILKIIQKYKPILVLNGHIHEGFGIQNIDGTVFVNPGAAKEGKYSLIKIDEENKVTASLLSF